MTFGGNHPCSLCRAVEKGSDAEASLLAGTPVAALVLSILTVAIMVVVTIFLIKSTRNLNERN